MRNGSVFRSVFWLPFSLLIFSKSLFAGGDLISYYDWDAKEGYYCDRAAGQWDCRSNLEGMWFPDYRNASEVISLGPDVCALNRGELACGGPHILKERKAPDILMRASEIKSFGRLLCVIDQGQLHCLDNSSFAEVPVPHHRKASRMQFTSDQGLADLPFRSLTVQVDGEVWLLDYDPAKRSMKISSRAPLPKSEVVEVVAAMGSDVPGIPAAALACYAEKNSTLTCQLGLKKISRALGGKIRQIVNGHYDVCAWTEQGEGDRLDCFSRLSLTDKLELVAYQPPQDGAIDQLSQDGMCVILRDGKARCWFPGQLHPTLYDNLPSHLRFLPYDNMASDDDDEVCAVGDDGGGCFSRHGFVPFPKTDKTILVYGAKSACRVDEKGDRYCRGNRFTWDARYSKLTHIQSTEFALALFSEKGMYYLPYQDPYNPGAKFIPYQWGSEQPTFVDKYSLIWTGKELRKLDLEKLEIADLVPVPWPLKNVEQGAGFDTPGSFENHCLLERGTGGAGRIVCFSGSKPDLHFEWSDYISDMAEVGLLCASLERGPLAVRCVDSHYQEKLTFPSRDFYPLLYVRGSQDLFLLGRDGTLYIQSLYYGKQATLYLPDSAEAQ